MNRRIKALMAICMITVFTVSIMLWRGYIPNPFAGNNKDSLTYSGTAEADEINITSELAGKIKELKVQEGQKVTVGDLVAVINYSENSIKLQQSEISLKSAQNELEKVNEGSRAEEIKAQQALVSQAAAVVEQGEALLNQAQNSLDTAGKNYDYRLEVYEDVKALFDAGAESKSAVDNAQNALDNAKNVHDNAKSSVDSAKAQLEGYKAQLNAAGQKLNLLINGATKRDKNATQFGVDIAGKNYELSQLILHKSNVKSPMGGVIETVNYRQGEYVTPGAPIATLLDIENMYIKIFVPEKVLPLISVDKEVTLKSDFIKDKPIRGKITYISSEAEFTPMNIVTKEDRAKLVFAVKIKILDNLELIKPGMLLDANLQ